MQLMQSSAFEASFICLWLSDSGNVEYGSVAFQPRLQACDLALIGRAVDDQVANDGKIAQRLDGHYGFGRFPTGQNLAPVHPDRASPAHLGAAEPSIGKIGGFVLGDPIENIEDPHPFLIRHLEILKSRLPACAVGPANPHRDRVAGGKTRIAGRKRIVHLDLAETPGIRSDLDGCWGRGHHATSRLSLVTKSGRKIGRSYFRCSNVIPLADFFRTFATSQFSLSVSGKS